MLITPAQLRQVVPTISVPRAVIIADNCNFICPKYGIDTKDIFHEFLANVAHESGGFVSKTENMNYTAQRMAEVWPNRFSITTKKPYKPNNLALSLHRKPVELANLTYGGRMGNIPGTNDGWLFRGGGYMGLTGRYTYTKYQQYIAFDTVENCAEVVRTDEYYAMDSSAWVFAVELKLIQLAKDDKFLPIVKKINGGTIGLRDREGYYERAKKFVI